MSGPRTQRSSPYQTLFGTTRRRRMRYVNKICFLVAVSASVILRFPYGSFWWNLVDSLYRVPVLFAALWVVKKTRDQNTTVDFSPAKSLAEHIVSTVCSGRFVATYFSYLASSVLVFAVFLAQLPLMVNYYVLAKEFRVKPAVNDTWVYFWFHAVFAAVFYAFQHVTFQRNRLSLAYGVASVKPETALFSNPAFLAGTAVFFSVFCSLVAPIAYVFLRSFIYRTAWPILVLFSLDTTSPPLRIGFANLLNVSFASFVLFFAWEIANHAYTVYASIGCIDGKSPISSRSSDPVATLLSGLRDVDPEHAFSRTTAFQELAYVASSADPYCVKTRNAIFNTQSRGSTWPAILDECSLVIRNTSSRINQRSKADMAALRNTETYTPDANTSVHPEQAIFGNSHDSTSNDTTQFAVSATSSPLKKNDAFEQRKPGFSAIVKGSKVAEKFTFLLWAPLQHYAESFYGPATTRKKAQLHEKATEWRTLFWHAHDLFLGSSVGVLFRTTLKRDAESRVSNPALYASAVLALSGLLIHAIEEDRSGTVTNSHVTEILNVLERPIRSSANYTDILPASVYLTPAQKRDHAETRHHLVAVMHDLTMTEFFQLCVKYNYKLNDLSLSSRAFKLAKWVIDASIAQQQKEEKTQMGKYL